MKYYCNPINVPYHYQFIDGRACREAADPSMIEFKGRYYIFASMNLSVWVSDDLVTWESVRLPESLPLYDYAPDVRVCGEYVYFSASRRDKICNYYRTKDIVNGPYEEFEGTFPFWDPNLFADEDGRMYFYWGCSNMTPIWGVELDPETMKPLGEWTGLIEGTPCERGYERVGENNSVFPAPEEEVEAQFQAMLKKNGRREEDLPEDLRIFLRGTFTRRPYIEGPWMTRYQGKYYLQYAFAGTQYNTYGDGVYIGDSPLGPFTPADNNPYSYSPGGFLPGAGHGSTMWDHAGNLWHTSSMRISVNHNFERRVGLWKAGFDADGELFCNQRFGDWPIAVPEEGVFDPWAAPSWYLLSYGKTTTASSFVSGEEPSDRTGGQDKGASSGDASAASSSPAPSRGVSHAPSNAVDENVQTWWRAASAEPGEWIEVDLGEAMEVHAVQVNFADDEIRIPVPGEVRESTTQPRFIDPELQRTRWLLEGSADGVSYVTLADRSQAQTDLTHELIVLPDILPEVQGCAAEGADAACADASAACGAAALPDADAGAQALDEGCAGIDGNDKTACRAPAGIGQLRYIRLTILEAPYGQQPCISGLRVFGKGNGEKPGAPSFTVMRSEDRLDFFTSAKAQGAVGYNILWGHREDKLYHSSLVFGEELSGHRIGALVSSQEYWVRVDAFNENGITEGVVRKLC